ncbi:MAG: uroporphyrinogen-III synthase [Anaerolineae bacterium]|nr:uroporphyrinogen-III synthase [Anaerolineae bacterium]
MTLPLHGKTIVNTRAIHQVADFDVLIRERGAIPVSFPCIAIVPPDDTTEWDAAIQQLIAGAFDWLILTSTNTVYSLSQRLKALELSLRGNFKTAAIGPSTADAARTQLGIEVDLMPDEYIAEALAETLLLQGAQRVFLPESAIARPALKDALVEAGVAVMVVDAYQTACASGGVDLPAMLRRAEIDAITFTSSSTVDCFIERLTTENGSLTLGEVVIACIGPKTAQTAIAHGLQVVIVPQDYTLSGLLDAIENYYIKDLGGQTS